MELKIEDIQVKLSLKMDNEDMILCMSNQSSDKSLKCTIDTFVMAHKVGKKHVHSKKSLEICASKESQWKVQDSRFFILNCLSKRDIKNEAVIRFKTQIGQIAINLCCS